MPLMIVSEEEWEKEISNAKKAEIVTIKKGRGEGNKEVPEEVKKLLSVEDLNGGSAFELGKALKISSSSISAYKNGATSTASYHEPKIELKTHIDGVKDRISRKAKRVILKSLDSITNDKLDELKPTDAAAVARQMSAIIKEMEPERIDDKKDNLPQFIVFAPQFNKEDHYETIVAKE